MSRWIERKLRGSSQRLARARRELAVLDEQVVSLRNDADELETRAIVTGSGRDDYYRRDAAGHVEAVERQRQRLRQRIADLEREQDELLDRLQLRRG
jgi:chromosome segregation ATPase